MRSGFSLAHRVAAALLTLALLSAMLHPAGAAEEKSLTAIFLVARDELPDPNFAGARVLAMNDLGPAPIGIIINRPTRILVSSLFPGLKQLTQLNDKVYFGGPVDLESVWFLFRAASRPEQAIKATEGVYLSASRKLLFQLLARSKPMEGLRIFIGHSGWAPGQLEAEIANGDWRLEHASSDALFSGKPEHPWPSTQEPKDAT